MNAQGIAILFIGLWVVGHAVFSDWPSKLAKELTT